jgi:hypothetical protein
MFFWIRRLLLLVLAVGLVLGGVIALGKLARDDLRPRERYTISFAEIECRPPPGLNRLEFLEQVPYYASVPVKLGLLEEDLPRRLADCFSRHPWVEKVEAVEVTPPRRVHVKLVYRKPVLAVPWDSGVRAVDGNGILLPKSAPIGVLPLYRGHAAAPAGPEGTRWGDPAVEAAAHALAGSRKMPN